jgi:hypothetical protein
VLFLVARKSGPLLGRREDHPGPVAARVNFDYNRIRVDRRLLACRTAVKRPAICGMILGTLVGGPRATTPGGLLPALMYAGLGESRGY